MAIVSIINYCYFHQKCSVHVLTQRAETPIADTAGDLVPLRRALEGWGHCWNSSAGPARRDSWSLESTGKHSGECWGGQAGPQCRAEAPRDALG